MIYRKLDANDDMVFGRGRDNAYRDTPEAVAQAVKTRLGLMQGEWFLDTSVGTPYATEILGAGTVATFDLAIQDQIRSTPGVVGIATYASAYEPSTRQVSIVCTIDTVYGKATLQAVI